MFSAPGKPYNLVLSLSRCLEITPFVIVFSQNVKDSKIMAEETN